MDVHSKIYVKISGIRPLLQNAFMPNDGSELAKKGKTYDVDILLSLTDGPKQSPQIYL